MHGDEPSTQASIDAVARMRRYAAMVRHLIWVNYDDTEWLAQLHAHAAAAWPNTGTRLRPLLPHLTILTWREDRSAHFGLCRLFFRAELEGLTLASLPATAKERDEAAVQARRLLDGLRALGAAPVALVVRIVATDSPQDRVAGVDGAVDPGVTPFLTPALEALIVTVGTSEASLLARLAGSTALTTLVLELQDTPALRGIALPALTSLDLRLIAPTRDTALFMKQLDCPKLGELKISLGVAPVLPRDALTGPPSLRRLWTVHDDDDSESRAAVQLYTAGVLKSNYAGTLHTFDLTYRTKHYEEPYTHGVRAEHALFVALCTAPLPHLTTLGLQFSTFKLGGAHLAALTAAHPALETFNLTRAPGAGPHTFALEPGTHLPELLAALQHVPRLRTLALALGTPAPWCAEDHGVRARAVAPPHPSLRRWHVLDAVVGDHVEIYDEEKLVYAQTLRACLPALRRIDYAAGLKDGERWETITGFLVLEAQAEAGREKKVGFFGSLKKAFRE